MDTNAKRSYSTRAIAILGMATSWPAISNQLLYPIPTLYEDSDAITTGMFYFPYFIVLLACSLVLARWHEQAKKNLFENRVAPVLVGCLYLLASLLILMQPNLLSANVFLSTIGTSLLAFYVPIALTFWGRCIISAGKGEVTVDVALSFIVYCLLTVLRLVLHLDLSLLAAFYAAINLVLVCLATSRCADDVPSGPINTKAFPLYAAIPSIAFIYICSFSIVLLRTAGQAEYGGKLRAACYAFAALVIAVIAFAYWHRRNDKAYAALNAFTVLSTLLVGVLLFAGFGVVDNLGVDEYPIIACKLALTFFLWLVLLVTCQAQDIDITRPAMVYLVCAISIPSAISIIGRHYRDLISTLFSNEALLGANIICAVAIMVVINAIFIWFLTHKRKQEATVVLEVAEQVTPQMQNEELYRIIAERYELTNRQVEILDMAYHNRSAKSIARDLVIAESTAYTHLKRIYRKLDVHSRQELINLLDDIKQDEMGATPL